MTDEPTALPPGLPGDTAADSAWLIHSWCHMLADLHRDCPWCWPPIEGEPVLKLGNIHVFWPKGQG
jgi:hypothetical protein